MLIMNLRRKHLLFPFRSEMGKIIRQYSFTTLAHLLVRWYSSPFEMIQNYLPAQGHIYDLGCGHGLMLHWLAKAHNNWHLHGIDIDEKKIAFADAFQQKKSIKFQTHDICRNLSINDAHGIVINDVLHFIPLKKQIELLKRCYTYLADEGVLILKEMDTQPVWKYHWTRIQEHFVNNVFKWTRAEGFYTQSQQDLSTLLQQFGFKVTVIPAHKGYAYPHIFFICQKDLACRKP